MQEAGGIGGLQQPAANWWGLPHDSSPFPHGKPWLLRLPLKMGDVHLHNLPHNATQYVSSVEMWEQYGHAILDAPAENTMFYSTLCILYSVIRFPTDRLVGQRQCHKRPSP